MLDRGCIAELPSENRQPIASPVAVDVAVAPEKYRRIKVPAVDKHAPVFCEGGDRSKFKRRAPPVTYAYSSIYDQAFQPYVTYGQTVLRLAAAADEPQPLRQPARLRLRAASWRTNTKRSSLRLGGPSPSEVDAHLPPQLHDEQQLPQPRPDVTATRLSFAGGDASVATDRQAPEPEPGQRQKQMSQVQAELQPNEPSALHGVADLAVKPRHYFAADDPRSIRKHYFPADDPRNIPFRRARNDTVNSRGAPPQSFEEVVSVARVAHKLVGSRREPQEEHSAFSSRNLRKPPQFIREEHSIGSIRKLIETETQQDYLVKHALQWDELPSLPSHKLETSVRAICRIGKIGYGSSEDGGSEIRPSSPTKPNLSHEPHPRTSRFRSSSLESSERLLRDSTL